MVSTPKPLRVAVDLDGFVGLVDVDSASAGTFSINVLREALIFKFNLELCKSVSVEGAVCGTAHYDVRVGAITSTLGQSDLDVFEDAVSIQKNRLDGVTNVLHFEVFVIYQIKIN